MPHEVKDDDLLTIEQVAREIGLQRRTSVQRLCRADPSFPRAARIPGVKGHRWVRGDVEAWKAHKVEVARRENAARLEAAKNDGKKVRRA